MLKKKIVITVVGAAALLGIFVLGGEVNIQDAATVLVSGDISELCQNLEVVPVVETPAVVE